MKTIKNAIQSFMLEIRECHNSDEIFLVWFVLAVSLGLIVGLICLTISFPIAGLCIFSVIFLPTAFICYSKFSDVAIDDRIKKLHEDRPRWY